MKFGKHVKGINTIEAYAVAAGIKDTNCSIDVGCIKTKKLFDALLNKYDCKVITYIQNNITVDKMILEFVLRLPNNIYVHVDDGETAEVIFNDKVLAKATKVAEFIATFGRGEEQAGVGNIYMLVYEHNYLRLRDFKLKIPKTPLYVHYNDDFKPFADKTVKALESEDAGIILMHGEPGTGKTTFIRYLTTMVNKKFIFLPPAFGEVLTSPNFIPFLMNNPDTIIVMEDAENVLKERDLEKNHSQISNVLNLTDGMVGDFIKPKIIFTFNCPITQVDKAILRKGRCKAQYEFKKLTPERANLLAKEVGLNKKFTKPLTIAEIFNQDEK